VASTRPEELPEAVSIRLEDSQAVGPNRRVAALTRPTTESEARLTVARKL
jgi:hypothetical protein